MIEQRRGQLTDRIKARSVELLGYEISQKELRLLPYISHTAMNSRFIDQRKVDGEEREILHKWLDANYLTGNEYADLSVTKEFWLLIHDLLWLSYVDLFAPMEVTK